MLWTISFGGNDVSEDDKNVSKVLKVLTLGTAESEGVNKAIATC